MIFINDNTDNVADSLINDNADNFRGNQYPCRDEEYSP